jgi:hypothetical protein
MKRAFPGLLFAILVAAGPISTYSDRTAATATSRSSERADGSADRAYDAFEMGRFTTVDVPGATPARLFAISDPVAHGCRRGRDRAIRESSATRSPARVRSNNVSDE